MIRKGWDKMPRFFGKTESNAAGAGQSTVTIPKSGQIFS